MTITIMPLFWIILAFIAVYVIRELFIEDITNIFSKRYLVRCSFDGIIHRGTKEKYEILRSINAELDKLWKLWKH